ncbi:MAG: sn-glycerol-3-phosphate ABC transporter ATP-binding protein UgpC [Actinomycetota bacterium]|nr:sn-glycerol-3-phosphate ABC transporter ATP-binding protein UgpC [Actinomycetota bacterium]
MASVTLAGVGKRYGHALAVDGVDLTIRDGSFTVLVGPSGCGKTTTLRMVAGLEDVTDGEIRIGDRVVNDLPAADRDIAMVFQNYALYPHMTVGENIGFGLRLRGTPKPAIAARIDEVAQMLGLGDLLRRKPRQLSGGQRQRVALGRAIARRPSVFLMDEPLSNLDAQLRAQTRAELIRLHRDLGATFVYVTHDQVEAMTMGEQVVVMREGRIQQAAPPRAVYLHPASSFVASFIGSPATNLVPAEVRANGGGPGLRLAGGVHVELPSGLQAAVGGLEGKEVLLGVRPEHVRLRTDNGAPYRVEMTELLGHQTLVHLRGEGPDLVSTVDSRRAPQAGEEVLVAFDEECLNCFEPVSGRNLTS